MIWVNWEWRNNPACSAFLCQKVERIPPQGSPWPKNTTKCQNKCPPSHLYPFLPAGAEEHKIVSQITLINFCFCHVLFSRGLNAFWYVNLYSFFWRGKRCKTNYFFQPTQHQRIYRESHFQVKVKTTEVYYKNGATKRRWNKRSPFPVKRNISSSTNFFCRENLEFFSLVKL